MKELSPVTRWIVLLFIVVFTLSCSATSQKRSLGELIDDGVITNKLKTRFMKDKSVKAHQIDIDTWKGVVSLKGTVDTQEQVDRAVEIAERQGGVKEVKSYLVLSQERGTWTSSSRKSSAATVEERTIQEKQRKENASTVVQSEKNQQVIPERVKNSPKEMPAGDSDDFMDEENFDDSPPPAVTPE